MTRVRRDQADPALSPPDRAAELDSVLELCDRRRLAPLDLRLLLALSRGEASPGELAELLATPPAEVRCAARRLAMRGLIRRRMSAPLKQRRLAITSSGLATTQSLLPDAPSSRDG